MDHSPQQSQGSVSEVFRAFLKLGLTSFGGPIAHLGYFRDELVTRRKWLSESAYTDLLALCQFLPGPASSQVGFALGLTRAGWLGAFAAFLAFTLPSAMILLALAMTATRLESPLALGVLHGLKIVAVAIVAQAVWGMAKNLCPDRPRATVAILAALITLTLPSALGQISAIALAGLWGAASLRHVSTPRYAAHAYPVSRRQGVAALTLFCLLLIGLPLWVASAGSPVLTLIDGVYRAGALVFGGGHVVLPLLQATVVPDGFVSNADFVAGYGAAQAVPGPLFTFAAYLGTIADGPLGGWAGGLTLLGAIFLPAVLVLIAALPFWEALRHRAGMQAALAGVNAGVVGILLSALYDPVWTSAIHDKTDFGLALAAFALLVYGRMPPVFVVALTSASAWLIG